jgi:soluble lytic murein transglycosylase-like protein
MMQGVDPLLALSVAKVESNYNQSAIGLHKEVGIFQIKPSNEYKPKQLKDLHNNIKIGILMLKQAQKDCKHKDNLTYVVCYNAGIYGGGRIKNPDKFPYVMKVSDEYNRLENENGKKTSN